MLVRSRLFAALAAAALGFGALATTLAPAPATAHASRPMAADIVDTAVQAGSFKTLVAAVQAAGLVDTLKSAGPFTVFAPTDAAFAALPNGTVQTLLKPENKDQLRAVLTYHVVPGAVFARDLAGRVTDAKTAQGDAVVIDGRNGVTVNNANVIRADIRTRNGVIHVVDRVLLPR